MSLYQDGGTKLYQEIETRSYQGEYKADVYGFAAQPCRATLEAFLSRHRDGDGVPFHLASILLRSGLVDDGGGDDPIAYRQRRDIVFRGKTDAEAIRWIILEFDLYRETWLDARHEGEVVS